MKLAFSTLACPAWSVTEVAEAALRFGYQGVELRLIDGELIDPGMSSSERKRIGEIFSRAGLPIVAVDSSVQVAAAADADSANRELASFLELAAAWESPLVRVFGGEWSTGRSREEAIAQAKRVLAEAAGRAEPLGIRVALETHDRFSEAALVAEVLEGLPPAAVALWDVGHPYRLGESSERVLRLLGPRIAHVHLKDARRPLDGGLSDEWQLTLLGEGEVPVEDSVDALRSVGYEGWLSVEWEKHWHPELAGPEVALPQFAEIVRSWF